MNFRNTAIIAIFIILGMNCPAQNDKKAKEALSAGNMQEAIHYLNAALRTDPKNYEYHALIGFAYLSSNIDKSKAVVHFEQALKGKNPDPYIYYDLGRAYMLNYRFDEAIDMFTKFTGKISKEEKGDLPAKRYIEMCENAKILMSLRSHVTMENIGDAVNSEFPEYNPFIDENESVLYFSSKRSKNAGSDNLDGFKNSDIYVANFDGTEWKNVKRLPPPINTAASEEIVGLAADESSLFIFMSNEYNFEDVFISTKRKKSFLRPEDLGNMINTSFSETAASISPCGNWLFFSSSKPGGTGGLDIYYSRKLPNGDWSIPVNAGKTINTGYDDSFPYLAPDGKTFYFCSQGHNSMGGYDIFKSTWDPEEQTFSIVENLGYPINTPADNKTISVSKSGRYAYISDFRENGNGDLDIYKVIFLDTPPPHFIIQANLLSADSVSFISGQHDLKTDYKIVAAHAGTKEQMGVFRPNPHNGQFSMILAPGFYLFDIYADDKKIYSSDYVIEEREPFHDNIELNIIIPNIP